MVATLDNGRALGLGGAEEEGLQDWKGRMC